MSGLKKMRGFISAMACGATGNANQAVPGGKKVRSARKIPW